MELIRLRELDTRPWAPLLALNPSGPAEPSHSKPVPFVCSDGSTYWLKGDAQQGLVAELVSGRLAHRLGAGAKAVVIDVPEEAVLGHPELEYVRGVVVGMLDLKGIVNVRQIEPLLADGRFDPSTVDAASRALVVTFQTWIGVGDTQVFIDPRTGRLYSGDHADAFGSLGPEEVTVTCLSIPGVDDRVGREISLALPAIEAIESVSDDEILGAVACVPDGQAWNGGEAHRLAVAEWLASRRARVRPAVEAWCVS